MQTIKSLTRIAYCLSLLLIGYWSLKGALLGKTGIEFHWLGHGIKLKKRLARGDPGINRLDRIAKQHDINYSKAKNLQDDVINSARAFNTSRFSRICVILLFSL